ncbi:MAG: heme-binding protein [Rhodovibrio sp.]|nr:heme-binding protein [Rhodovibrio sp.]
MLAGCGGGSRGGSADTGANDATDCTGFCQDTATRLGTGEVRDVIARAAAEATARGEPATIAVVDRVGNVLGLLPHERRRDVRRDRLHAEQAGAVDGGLEEIEFIPDTLAAISKAITGAYLSSEGNAFTSRTASQIVQAHFNPGDFRTAGGPLFGVQFSQLPCSDLAQRFTGAASATVGPHRAPLGLSADAGGLPLYKNGTPVGGIGVIADDVYGLSPKALDGGSQRSLDEQIALAGSFGFGAPTDRRGNRITVEGKTLRFAAADPGDLVSDPRNPPAFGGLAGTLPSVPGYTNGTIRAGTPFSKPASGIRASTDPAFNGQDAFVLVDGANNPRFPPTAGTAPVGDALSVNEVETILSEALAVANRARAQIRRPLGSKARVTISVVDTDGNVLGIVRGRDAPVFGIDVSLQKARTAAFFSGADAASELNAAPDAEYLDARLSAGAPTVKRAESIGQYVTAVRDFLGAPNALMGGTAFADRSGGNLSRPFFPDGIDGNPPGPFSKPGGHDLPTEWSPFSVGLQLDLSYNALIQHVAFAAGLVGTDAPSNCTGVGGLSTGFTNNPADAIDTVRNGIQIFPGSVPIYRDDTLVGGIGVSGDGIEQDDLISFLGLHNAGEALGTINNAPKGIRADRISIPGFDVKLRYVQCPQKPFLDSDEQKACEGK